tara:strand:+ start:3757 stop:4488 length:732 start_codon:yes stop_codon:yes gene_type:complete
MKSHINTILIALAIIATALIGSDAFKSRNTNKNSISVTGLGSESFVSDLIVWSGSFAKRNYSLKQAYYELEKDKQVIQRYMINEGLKRSNLIFSAVDINKEFKNIYDEKGTYKGQEFVGYRLTQEVEIESKQVEKVEGISRNISELINRGIEFDSKSPRYYYTGLAELKLKMISAATKDANNRAKNIAKNAESKVGKLKSAKMGVFQIVGQNSSESYSWGGSFNTSSKRKTASITMKLEYETE